MEQHEYSLYKNLRRMYFQGLPFNDIAQNLVLSVHYVVELINDYRLKEKRERWYKYLVVQAYSTGRQISEVACVAGVKATTLNRVKRFHNIKTKRFSVHNKKITDEIKNQMVELYLSGMTGSEVAASFGYKTSKSVEDVLRQKGIKPRPARFRYKYNYDFFKLIDSHDKAYILGLLYTDGYIYRDYAGFGVQLTESDGYLLERIASLIGSDATVIHVSCDAKRKHMKNAKDMVRLGVYSKELAEQVKILGVVKRKTYHLSVPFNLIPENYRYSLLRGIMDGDGTVGVDKRGVIWLKASMKSKQFAVDICKMFLGDFSINRYENNYGDMYCVSIIGGRSNTIRVLNKMYEHKGDLYLQRKYDKIVHCL